MYLVLLVLLARCSGALSHYHPPGAELLASPPPPTPASSLQHVRGPHHPRGTKTRHDHYMPHRPDSHAPGTKLTQDRQLLRDEEHIREDLGSWISREETKKMSGEELEFHYFKLHDFDNNTKLDGLEILQAIQHIVHNHAVGPEGVGEEHQPPAEPHDDFTYYVELIDKVLSEDDLDGDGYLSYIEYVLGRQKDDHELRQTTTTAGL